MSYKKHAFMFGNCGYEFVWKVVIDKQSSLKKKLISINAKKMNFYMKMDKNWRHDYLRDFKNVLKSDTIWVTVDCCLTRLFSGKLIQNAQFEFFFNFLLFTKK